MPGGTENLLINALVQDEVLSLSELTGLSPAYYFVKGKRSTSRRNAPGHSTSAGAIFFGADALTSELLRQKRGAVSVQGIVAHEFGHILQFSRGESLLSLTYLCELHADYLAGYLLGRRLEGQEGNAPQALADFLATAAAYADRFNEHNPNATLSHGTAEQRTAAILLGFAARTQPLSLAYERGERIVVALADNFESATVAIRRLQRTDNDVMAAAQLAIDSEQTSWGYNAGAPSVTFVGTYRNMASEPLLVLLDVESFIIPAEGN